MMPSAKTVSRRRFPPEKISTKPKTVPCCSSKKDCNRLASMPGVGMCPPRRNTARMPSVNRIRLRRSGMLKILRIVLIKALSRPESISISDSGTECQAVGARLKVADQLPAEEAFQLFDLRLDEVHVTVGGLAILGVNSRLRLAHQVFHLAPRRSHIGTQANSLSLLPLFESADRFADGFSAGSEIDHALASFLQFGPLRRGECRLSRHGRLRRSCVRALRHLSLSFQPAQHACRCGAARDGC